MKDFLKQNSVYQTWGSKWWVFIVFVTVVCVLWSIYFINYLPCEFVKEHPWLFYRDIPTRCLVFK